MALNVAARAELESWTAWLDELGMDRWGVQAGEQPFPLRRWCSATPTTSSSSCSRSVDHAFPWSVATNFTVASDPVGCATDEAIRTVGCHVATGSVSLHNSRGRRRWWPSCWALCLSAAGPHRPSPPVISRRALIRGGAAQYLVHVPPGLEQPAGLVINLPGAGMTAGEQAAMTNYNAVADQHGFVVVYPDGIDLSWADGRGASVPDRQGVDDVGFLVALADRLTQDFGIDRGRVFATGMSAGAFMANRLGCARADVFPPSRRLPARWARLPVAPSQPVSVLEIHGTADDVVPFNGGPMVGRAGPATSCPRRRWPSGGGS